MKCTACGAEFADDASFCPKCGTPVNGGAAQVGGDSAGGPGNGSLQRGDRSGRADEPEEKLWQGGFSGKAMIGTWIGCVIATLALSVVAFALVPTGIGSVIVATVICLLWVYAFGYFFYRRLGIEYELTNQRFIHKSGILVRTTDRIEVIDIDDVTYKQGIIERGLGVGTILLESSDRTHPTLVLAGIDDVQRVAGLIDDVRRKERRRRGIHIEQI
ncbi:MAG: PH domain-containing protein [Pirellulales bacterium]